MNMNFKKAHVAAFTVHTAVYVNTDSVHRWEVKEDEEW